MDSDVFALPSYTEKFGMAVAISDRVNIWREVKNAGAGKVVPCNAARVADALKILLDDPALCKAMGTAGKKLVKTEYDWNRVTDKMIDAYKRLASTR